MLCGDWKAVRVELEDELGVISISMTWTRAVGVWASGDVTGVCHRVPFPVSPCSLPSHCDWG